MSGSASNDTGRDMAPEHPFSVVIGEAIELPPPETRRWVIRRKAQIVEAVRHGVISLEAACERYALSLEEFLSWERLIDSHGVDGLRVTRLQSYREDATAGPAAEGQGR